MMYTLRFAAAALLVAASPTLGFCQTVGAPAAPSSMPSSSSTPTSPSASSPAPSGGAATGRSAMGAPTAAEKQAEKKMKKDTTICKGC